MSAKDVRVGLKIKKNFGRQGVFAGDQLDKDDPGRRATFYGKDELSSDDVRNISRFANSSDPPKGRMKGDKTA